MQSAQLRKFQKDIDSFKEDYPDVPIIVEDYKITFPDINCVLTFPLDWPFHPPVIKVGDITIHIKDWNMGTDLRTIYNFILYEDNNVQIQKLKEKFPEIEIVYEDFVCIFEITYKNLDIIISKNKISVYEDNQEWPEYMIPSKYSFDLVSMFEYIIKLRDQPENKRNVEKLESSLRVKFDNIVYNSIHRTFIIDDPKGLIIVGVPDKSYLSPNITIYRQGHIWSVNCELGDDSDLGEVLVITLI
jgi:hypothetical protein